MERQSSKKKKVNLFLDTETLEILDRVSIDFLRTGSKSGAVRFLAKEWNDKQADKTNQG